MGKVASARWIYQNEGPGQLTRKIAQRVHSQFLSPDVLQFVRQERSEWQPQLGWSRRATLYRRGFLSRSDVLYDFQRNGFEDYLTDYQRIAETPSINGAARGTLVNKYRFHEALEPFDEHRPEVFGVVHGGQYYDAPRTEPRAAALPVIDDVLERERRIVCKPITGSGGGEGVRVCSKDEGTYHVDGVAVTDAAFERWLADREWYLVTEYVDQNGYARSLYPEATNTIRIVTMRDEKGTFVADTVQRIGTSDTAPLDNWEAGGLAAHVESDGTLSAATRKPLHGSRETLTEHPDTGAQIEGRPIPNWDSISKTVREIAASLEDIVYVGWDILPTADGFKILEGNAHFDVDIMQTHVPLLADERVRRFYAAQGLEV